VLQPEIVRDEPYGRNADFRDDVFTVSARSNLSPSLCALAGIVTPPLESDSFLFLEKENPRDFRRRLQLHWPLQYLLHSSPDPGLAPGQR
jgi:hypothetical protein